MNGKKGTESDHKPFIYDVTMAVTATTERLGIVTDVTTLSSVVSVTY